MSVFFSTFTIMENILLYFCCICCIMFFALKMFIKITFSTPRIVTYFYIQNREENFWEFLLYFSPYYTTRKFSQIVSHRNNKKLCSQKKSQKNGIYTFMLTTIIFFTFFQVFLQKIKFAFFIFHFFCGESENKKINKSYIIFIYRFIIMKLLI